MKLKVAISGFGRIGRNVARILIDQPDMTLVAINSQSDSRSHAYLLRYDSTYGIFNHQVKAQGESIVIDDQIVKVYRNSQPQDIPWHKDEIDIVIDATGKFRTRLELQHHLRGNIKYVVLTAPAKDDVKTIIIGVNQHEFNPQTDLLISSSSCTTNCLATTMKVLQDRFQVIRGFMTTTHAVTDSQNILDNSHKKSVRLRRASFASIIPAATGSARDIIKIFPQLSGKIVCQALRVPIFTVSLINLTAQVKRKITKEDIHQAFQTAASTDLKGILNITDEELVSTDFTGNSHSAIIDSNLTSVIDSELANLYAWYDNEWGYANRVVDLLRFIGKQAKILKFYDHR